MKGDLEQEFEAELRGLRPVSPRREMLERVLEVVGAPEELERQSDWLGWVRWLVPAAGIAAIAAVLVFHLGGNSASNPIRDARQSASTPLKADHVEIDRQWLANFDAVGSLPGGQPIRFRCAQWLDTVWLRDAAAGLVIERTTPRVEIVPVGFETY